MRSVEWMEPASAPLDAKVTESEFATAALIGKKVSHYRVLEILGRGGMGIVYKAEDIKLGRKVAVKFLPEELAQPRALEWFEREARSASALNHPNICTIHEIAEHDGQPLIVMELLEGKTLREVISSTAGHQPLELRIMIDLVPQIAAGLEAAHQKGIIHRDIKPSNIFITSRGEAKILDFGVGKLLEFDETVEAKASIDVPGETQEPPPSRIRGSELTITEQTPDREQLIFTAFDSDSRGRELTRFKTDPKSYYNYVWDLSPDGTRIAVLKGSENRITILSLRGERPREITVSSWNELQSVDWKSGGEELLASSHTKDGVVLFALISEAKPMLSGSIPDVAMPSLL
jgi:serine/threonine protein kinase